MRAPTGSVLLRNFHAYQVFGANTNVGKTIFSTLLCSGARSSSLYERLWYLKPVSTGPCDEADVQHIRRFTAGVEVQNLYQFNDPISPHLAAASEIVPDTDILRQIRMTIQANSQSGRGFMLIESAGGPHSPAPSGTSQLELYRGLRLPTVLIGDSNLGGISTSISAYESLTLHGLTVDAVAMFENPRYQNHDYLRQYFADRGIAFFTTSQPPSFSTSKDFDNMRDFYTQYDAVATGFVSHLASKHETRIQELESMATTAEKHIWYPFTQHKGLKSEDLTVIDSAHGDYFQTFKKDVSSDASLLKSSFDGSASWWTQGLGHANSRLTTAAAAAAGRYGHVMFASAIHQPALSLATRLLGCLKNPRLSRVFYSDNGSTAMEVAVKMGLKATSHRYDLHASHKSLEILGLRNSYHGDTLGTMDMSEPSVFNDQISWYKGRGFWFDSPSVSMTEGKWVVRLPECLKAPFHSEIHFDTLQDVFDTSRDESREASLYRDFITVTLKQLTLRSKRQFGALVMEPVVLGAGGMVLVDPLFQRMLVEVVRGSQDLLFQTTSNVPQNDDLSWRGLPVISDEVFTGLFRLGRSTSSSLLGFDPDISVHAKLLTGGLIPLATTVASESIFEAFLGDNKADCLLHGHSYTAHPVGCAVALASLNELEGLERDGKYDLFKRDWMTSASHPVGSSEVESASTNSMLPLGSSTASPRSKIWSVWSRAVVQRLSHSSNVDRVWALGSVLSITIKDPSGHGYTSDAALRVRDDLYKHDIDDWNIHARVLGNVLYFMASQISRPEHIRLWESRIEGALHVSS